MFSVDTQTVYHNHYPSEAVWHNSTDGPWFTGTLGIHGDTMSDKDIGGSTCHDDAYPVRPDGQGNCPLTGVIDRGEDEWNTFTAEEIEVFSVKVQE